MMSVFVQITDVEAQELIRASFAAFDEGKTVPCSLVKKVVYLFPELKGDVEAKILLEKIEQWEAEAVA